MTLSNLTRGPKDRALPLTFCLLSAFLPLGSTVGVLFSWVIFPITAILLTLMSSPNFHKKGVRFFLFSAFILLINYAVCVRYVDYKQKLEFNLLLALIGSFYMSVCFFSVKFKFKSLCKAIDVTLTVNVILFLTQFIAHYLFGYKIDYSELTGGEGTRNDYGTIFRASGIYNEPAEYSSAMIVLLTVRYFISNKFSKIHLLSLLSVALSFSFVGIIQSVAVFIVIYFKEIHRRPVLIIPIMIISALAFYAFSDLFIQRYQDFIMGVDGSNNTKVGTVNYFLENSNYLYGGAGLIGYDPSSMPVFMQGLYDLTFFGACITIFGVLLGSVIASSMLFYITTKYNKSRIILIMICLAKVNVMIYASYWFFVIALIVIPGRKWVLSKEKKVNESKSHYADDRKS